MTRIVFTDRLILRPLEEKDAEDAFEWVDDPIVNKSKDYEFGFELKKTGKVNGAGSVRFDVEQNAYHANANTASGNVIRKCGF